MNKGKITGKINQILEDESTDEELIIKVNPLLQNIEDDILGLHTYLSDKALIRIYIIINYLSIGNDAKEHIVWYYYKKVIQNETNYFNDNLTNSLILDFERYGFGALVSNAIDMIQTHKLSDEQMERIGYTFNSEILNKNIIIEKITRDVIEGKTLEKYQIEELINNEAYKLLEFAIDNNSVYLNDLDGFRYPEVGERNRKAKLSIYAKLHRNKA